MFYNLRCKEKFCEYLKNNNIDLVKITTIDPSEYDDLIILRKEMYELPNYDEYKISKEKSTKYKEYFDILFPDPSKDVKSFFLFQLLASSYDSITSWIIENEVKLFMKRYQYYIMDKRIFKVADIENYLFMNEIVPKDEKDEKTNAMFKIKWYWISPKMFNRDEYYMKDGWIYIPKIRITKNGKKENIEDKMMFIEYVSRVMFRDAISKLKLSLPDEQIVLYKDIAEHNFGEVKEVISFSSSFEEIDTIISNSPLCITLLDNTMQKIGINGYYRSLQMSFYMKQMLDEESLLKYFWKRDVRNRIYPTVDAFIDANMELKKHFDHQYGKSGSGTNYMAYSCSKTRKDGFCFYVNTPENVEKVIRELYTGKLKFSTSVFESMINKIKDCVAHKKYSQACALELCIRTGLQEVDAIKLHKGKLFINHPIMDYYKFTFTAKEKIKESEDTTSTDDEKDSESMSDDDFMALF